MEAVDSPQIAGAGLGLRSTRLAKLVEHRPQSVGWLEVVTENLFSAPPWFVDGLEQLAETYPMVLHGVGLNLGTTDALDETYLTDVAQWAERLGAAWLSDHLCWTGVGGRNSHDLLPLPTNEATVAHCVTRIEQVQDHWQQPLLIENVSAYVRPRNSDMTEWEFLSEVVQRSGCEILLDINNLWVNAQNFGFDPQTCLDNIPLDRVRQVHLAGHEVWDTLRVDTHSRPVGQEVWDLFADFVQRAGPVPTMIEWDRDIPSLGVMLEHVEIIDSLMKGGADVAR